MKRLQILLAAVGLAGVVWAQCAVQPSAATTTGAAVTPGVCATATDTIHGLCPAVLAEDLGGTPTIMVLGSEESYAINTLNIADALPVKSLVRYNSLFDPNNPLTTNRPNLAVLRHGNPYYPYFALVQARGGRVDERFAALMQCPNPLAQGQLRDIAVRYRTLTTQQACALGYQPLGVCVAGMGQVYLNPRLVDNVYDPMVPEAIIYSADGRPLGVSYLMATNQPYTVFGQVMYPSEIVPGAQQVSVWLYQANPNGLFAARNPNVTCRVAGSEESRRCWPRF